MGEDRPGREEGRRKKKEQEPTIPDENTPVQARQCGFCRHRHNLAVIKSGGSPQGRGKNLAWWSYLYARGGGAVIDAQEDEDAWVVVVIETVTVLAALSRASTKSRQ